MSVKGLKLAARDIRNEEEQMDADAEADAKFRASKTPPQRLTGRANALFKKCRAAMPVGLQGVNQDKVVGFRLDMYKIESPVRDDVMKRVIAMFGELGFKCRHVNNVGVVTLDVLEITAPKDWVQRLLTPRPAPRKKSRRQNVGCNEPGCCR